MKLPDVMTYGVRTASVGDTVREVAEVMRELDVGSLPVCDGERLVGMVTDRDIVIRVVARGLPADTSVCEAMTSEVDCCFEDDDLHEVADRMARAQLRRLQGSSVDRHRGPGGPRPSGQAEPHGRNLERNIRTHPKDVIAGRERPKLA